MPDEDLMKKPSYWPTKMSHLNLPLGLLRPTPKIPSTNQSKDLIMFALKVLISK